MNKVYRKLRILLFRDPFVKNLTIAGGGSFVAYMLGFLFTPVIARIYPPEVYGTYSLMSALISNLTAISSLSFVAAFVLPRKEETFKDLLVLAFSLVVITFVVCSILTLLLRDFLYNYLGLEEGSLLLYLLPLFVLLSALGQLFQSWNVRMQDFKANARSKIASISIGKGATVAIGYFLGGNLSGFLLGDGLFRLTELLQLARNRLRSIRNLPRPQSNALRVTFFEFKNYPLFYLPSSWLGVFIYQIPLFVLGAHYNSNLVGQYAMTIGLLGIPIQVISFSLAQVYFEKMNTLFLKSDQSLFYFQLRFIFRLFLLGLLPFLAVVFSGEILYKIILGTEWITAGSYGRVLAIPFLLRFTFYPTHAMFRIARRERLYLQINLCLIVHNFIVLWISANFLSIMQFIYAIAFVMLLSEVVYFVFSNKIIKYSFERYRMDSSDP